MIAKTAIVELLGRTPLFGTLDESERRAVADEMREVADASPPLSGQALRRAEHALSLRHVPGEFDVAAARARFASLMNPQSAGAIA